MNEARFRGLTVKAILTGTVLSFLLVMWFSYAGIMVQGADLTMHFAGSGAVFILFVLVTIINPVLRTINRKLAFDPGELATVHIMMWMVTPMVTWGLALCFIPIISGITYYAMPENKYTELIGVHLPDWAVPRDYQAIVGFFEGAQKGEGIAWEAWIRPLSNWAIFLVALYVVMICLMSILRKQWVERERLLYPLTRVPVEMIQEGEDKPLFNPFFKNSAMWIGFALPFIAGTWYGLHSYFHFIPAINLRTSFPIFRNTIDIEFAIVFYMIGFSYLINLNIAFSLWFFCLLGTIQTGIFRMIGWSLGPREVATASGPSVSHQAMGAMIVLVLYGLWHARGHLKQVFAKAFRNDPEVDDSGEILSHRAAIVGCIAGLLVMIVWLQFAGLAWYFSLFFMFGALVMFIGLTRVVVEGGLACVKAPLHPQSFTVHGIGSEILGVKALSAILLTFSWASEVKTFTMASAAHGLKIADMVGLRRRRALFWAMMIATLIGLVMSVVMLLHLGYRYGAINLSGQIGGAGQAFANLIASFIQNPPTTDGWRWAFTGIGAGVMGLLMYFQHRFLWWPLHPLGFPVGNTLPMIHTWFSVFLAWLFKLIILKYGGAKVYGKLRPFFLGLVVGQVVTAGAWLIIDHFTGMMGNVVLGFE